MRIKVYCAIMFAAACITTSSSEIVYGESDIINLSSNSTTACISKQIGNPKNRLQPPLTQKKSVGLYTLYGRQMKQGNTYDLPTGVYFTDNNLFIINH